VGDLVELKNHLLAIEIAKRIRALGEDVAVLLVGRDVSKTVPRTAAYAERVRRAAAETPGVELTASTPERMPEVMARLDVLLHISAVPESFGRVCVEAMAAGRPVVAFDHGAARELVDHGKTGFLCPPGDADAAAKAVTKLLREPELNAEMGREARIRALERFDDRGGHRDTVGHALADFAFVAS
jgi:glycosyltransferase involved in cell wall biosynthesis